MSIKNLNLTTTTNSLSLEDIEFPNSQSLVGRMVKSHLRMLANLFCPACCCWFSRELRKTNITKTTHKRLEDGKKVTFFDCHRTFLPLSHPFRGNRKLFTKGERVGKGPPK
jgi:hypothetical protein